MRIQEQVRYPAAVADVATMLADPRFAEQVSERMGASSSRVEVAGDPSGAFTVTTVRTLPTDRFPDVARRFVGDSVDVEQVDRWQAPAGDGSRTGTIQVQVAGAPLRLTGTLRLEADGQGTLEVVDGDLKASVPLVGGALERAAEPAISAAIRQQERVGATWSP